MPPNEFHFRLGYFIGTMYCLPQYAWHVLRAIVGAFRR
jgi:hypothetical protein